jgi:hypothetical protein
MGSGIEEGSPGISTAVSQGSGVDFGTFFLRNESAEWKVLGLLQLPTWNRSQQALGLSGKRRMT